ncbi:hypothetical protein KC480_05235 [Bacillus velezensis]|uniref:Rad52/Rad22 family DNA repair protein n=1 Tax=Bacillus velezensis TaxID=492670 RepID=UPI001E54DC72|nr:Rad52/Rad22 family DNA repair protein [Bacillus velezensis]MCD7910928.1 hypothetical protein [Bacillus velezensis]
MREMTLDQIKNIKEKLKECKDEWLEKNIKGHPALGVSTVQQILDNATDGAWDFVIEEQWVEQVQKYNKQSNTWTYDGYVFHVKGYLYIEGLGRRSQFGSKIAVGGKDNQNSSYKAAASDCLKKCASLFGVGSSVYSKIKIETEEQSQQSSMATESSNQMVGQQVQNSDGTIQQGEYIWFNNQWVHQNSYYAMQQQQAQQQTQQQQGSYPSPGLTEQQKNQWYHETMQQYDPQGYEEMKQNNNTAFDQLNTLKQDIEETDRTFSTNHTEYPFENVQEIGAQQKDFQAQPQAKAEIQQPDFKAVPQEAPKELNIQGEKSNLEDDQLDNIKADNPWNTPEIKESIELFQHHKDRLGIIKDNQLLPHVREFFKDEKATIANVTPEVLKDFNEYLKNIQV